MRQSEVNGRVFETKADADRTDLRWCLILAV